MVYGIASLTLQVRKLDLTEGDSVCFSYPPAINSVLWKPWPICFNDLPIKKGDFQSQTGAKLECLQVQVFWVQRKIGGDDHTHLSEFMFSPWHICSSEKTHCLIHIIDGEGKAQLVFLCKMGLMVEASSELPRVEPPLIESTLLELGAYEHR